MKKPRHQSTRSNEENPIKFPEHTSFDAEQAQQAVGKELVLKRTAVGENLIEDFAVVRILLVEAEDMVKVLP